MNPKLKTTLFCLHCEKETPHTIMYRGEYLQRINCNICGMEIHIDKEKIMKLYISNALNRLFTKPGRITEEMRRDLSTFLISLPLRIVSKPYRVAKEFFEIVKKNER